MRPSFAVEESVRTLGANLKAARLRRRLPQSVVAERAGISLNTLSKLENGDCGIAIGNVASVLQALGLGTPFSDVAAAGDDEIFNVLISAFGEKEEKIPPPPGPPAEEGDLSKNEKPFPASL